MAVSHPIESWRLRVVIRILMIVAQLLADDAGTRKAVTDLSNHISVGS